MADVVLQPRSNQEAPFAKLPVHVAVLLNFISPYARPVLLELAKRVAKLTVLVSTPMERNRDWDTGWRTLDVRVQRTCTLRRKLWHSQGFHDSVHMHFPLDTFGQLRSLAPDVVVSSELGSRSFLATLYGRRHPNVATLLVCCMSEHTESGRGRVRTAWRRWLLAQAHAVTGNGRSARRYLERLGVPSNKIFLFPYAPAPEVLNWGPLEREKEVERRLLYVGQLIERKGLLPFIESLTTWARVHPYQVVEFDIVGSGPLGDRLRTLTLPPNVRIALCGTLSYEQLAKHYGRAGVFVLPTLADEWGLVVNEAMVAGLPVLGSVYGQAVTDLCTEGETGWLFRPDHPEETIAALDRCFATSSQRLLEMRHTARNRAEAITPAAAADALLEAAHYALCQVGRVPDRVELSG